MILPMRLVSARQKNLSIMRAFYQKKKEEIQSFKTSFPLHLRSVWLPILNHYEPLAVNIAEPCL
jgi:hypothetical protein